MISRDWRIVLLGLVGVAAGLAVVGLNRGTFETTMGLVVVLILGSAALLG